MKEDEIDPYTGEVFNLPEESPHEPGETISPEQLEALKSQMSSVEQAAVVERMIEQDRTAVAVSGEVAQKLALGDRELKRRKARNRRMKGIAGS